MNQQKSRKRRVGATGVKALIASASVAATLAGWAILPANDPQTANATTTNDQFDQQAPGFNVPNTQDNNPFGTLPQQPPDSQNQLPGVALPGSDLPQIQAPQTFPGRQRPFRSTHSSR